MHSALKKPVAFDNRRYVKLSGSLDLVEKLLADPVLSANEQVGERIYRLLQSWIILGSNSATLPAISPSLRVSVRKFDARRQNVASRTQLSCCATAISTAAWGMQVQYFLQAALSCAGLFFSKLNAYAHLCLRF